MPSTTSLATTTMKQQQNSPLASSSMMNVLFMLLVIIFMISTNQNTNNLSSFGVEALGRRPQFAAVQKAFFPQEEQQPYHYYDSSSINNWQFPNKAAAGGGGFFGLNNRQRRQQQDNEEPLAPPSTTEETSSDLETTDDIMQSSPTTTTTTPLLTAQHFITSTIIPKSKEYYMILSTKFVAWWKIFITNFHTISKDTYSFLRETLPTFTKSMMTNHPISVIAATTIIAGSYVWYISSIKKKQRLEYLEWDAKEMIPQIWTEIELQLEDKVLLEQEDLEEDDDDDEMKLRQAIRSELRKRIDLQSLLETKVNQAKAEQIVTLYAKHFPDQWKLLMKKKNIKNDDNDAAVQYIADHPALLEKLTRTLYRNKFVALLRPDYAFGMGRNGIDVTKMKIVASKKKTTKKSSKTKGNTKNNNNNSIDATLLESVADDLVMTCPKVRTKWNGVVVFTESVYSNQLAFLPNPSLHPGTSCYLGILY